MERGEGQLLHEAPRLPELGVRLAGKAGDEVRREVEARVQTHRARRERAVALRHDAAAHPLEDAERARLQRQMKVRDHGARGGGEIDEGLAGLHGLERGEPDPARGRVVFEPRKEVDEPRSTVVAERREVDAREHDLGHAGVSEAPDGIDDVLDAGAALFPAQRGHDAKRAPAFAAVLDLQERARPVRVDERLRRPVPCRHREERGACRRPGGDDPLGEETGLVGVEDLGQRVPRGERDDEIHLRHAGERFAVALGEAAGDDERRAGVFAPQAAHEAPAVALGPIRDRATVHEEDVRSFGPDRLHLVTGDFGEARGRRGVDPADLTAERRGEDAARAEGHVPVR